VNWKGKRVLVTGADGFIGSHVTEALARAGANVRAFCLYNSQGKLGWLEHSPADIRSQLDVKLGDIRDPRFVEEACRDVEVVFHLAALIAIPYSYAAPQSFVETNVDGTLNVLEACRRAGVARLVHTSTSEVYGTPESLPIRESHPLRAQSPYAATKVAADQLAISYHLSFGVPVTVLRPFNTYGPRQSTRAVTATILSQLLDGRETIQLGRLDTRRDLTFVSDVAAGFLAAGGAPGIDGMVIQLGTGKSVTIGELFEAACRITGKKARAIHDERRMRPEASEVLVLESDPSLARERLGWQPAVTLEEGLRRTAEWMREMRDSYRADFFYA
jgi:NAD dependent epimerase/dehydratase